MNNLETIRLHFYSFKNNRMKQFPTTTHIHLKNVLKISRGSEQKVHNYLNQFCTLIPERIEKLNAAIAIENRVAIRQILHTMSPQLQFFDVPDVVLVIRRLEFEYETMPIEELLLMVKNILDKLDLALEEVENIRRKE